MNTKTKLNYSMPDEKPKTIPPTETVRTQDKIETMSPAEEALFGPPVELPKTPDKAFYARLQVETDAVIERINKEHPHCADLFRLTLSPNIAALDPESAEGRLGNLDHQYFKLQLSKAFMTEKLIRDMAENPEILRTMVKAQVFALQDELQTAENEWRSAGSPDVKKYADPNRQPSFSPREMHDEVTVSVYQKAAAKLQIAFAAAREVGLVAS